ncbi:MAG: hypothetical protein M3Y66_08855, partial [Actinomycetota bacterium]|nr:hypothetical protein [Actinomycetota bacterium]
FICDVITNSGVKDPKTVCAALKTYIDPLHLGLPNIGAGGNPTPGLGSQAPQGTLAGLLGGRL